ncbi:MAG: zinc-binding dehydrogenase, partial [Elusimicrobia bacterium]|nr:zinc-binding dehydrogenase [Elusimicrobiota bacterium]
YADVIVREGHYEAAKGLYPITPGFEFAGTVDAVGDGVSVFKEGDRMFGFTRFGGRTFLPRLAWNWLRVPRFSPLELTGTNRSVMGFNVVHLTEKAELAREGFDAIAGWAREGKLKKPPVTSFPAERAADAHQALESGETVGKLVLTF